MLVVAPRKTNIKEQVRDGSAWSLLFANSRIIVTFSAQLICRAANADVLARECQPKRDAEAVGAYTPAMKVKCRARQGGSRNCRYR